MSKINRREFFVHAGQLVGAALAIPLVLRGEALAQERRRGGGASPSGGAELPLVSPKDSNAMAVNYVEKHSDLKKAEMKTERQGVKFEAQFCSNCSFYKAAGKKNGKDAGPCQIFPGKWVLGEAWCGSWNKKS